MPVFAMAFLGASVALNVNGQPDLALINAYIAYIFMAFAYFTK